MACRDLTIGESVFVKLSNLYPLFFFIAPTVIGLLFCTASVSAYQSDEEFFRLQVLPIFEKHCYECHSHRANTFEGGLSLDWKSGWSRGGDRGVAIIPGKPADSLLITAISHSDPDLKMPAEKLSDSQIAVITKWVQQGAWDDRELKPTSSDPRDWWSLRPLKRPEPPLKKTGNSNTTASSGSEHSSRFTEENPIDLFIADKLAEAKLASSQPAAPRDLLRRLYFDLTGMPPTYAQVSQFVADPSEQRYETIVDQLLASPRYGERWARHWFDTIHFAESHGYEHDVGRDNAWPYRDYFIRALNADKDWATLIREQIAVDVLKPEATDLIPALGFLGAGTFDLSTYSTGPVTFDYMDRDDMLTQTMSAFVSTTANCARCHAHKFDPISQEDYYALQAVFAGVLKGDIRYDADSTVSQQRSQLTQLRDRARRGDESILMDSAAQQFIAHWNAIHSRSATWADFSPSTFVSSDGATLTRIDAGVILASGTNPDTDTYTLTGSVDLKQISAIRLQVFPHDSLPMRGPGRCQNGNLHLSEVSITLFENGAASGKPLTIARATADFNQEGWGIERSIDGNAKTAWGIFPEVGKPHQAVFELQQPATMGPEAKLVVTLRQLHGGSHLLGAFKVSVTDAPSQQVTILPAPVEDALRVPLEKRSAEQTKVIAFHAIADIASSRLAQLPEPARVYAVGTSVEIPGGNGKYQGASLPTPKPVHLLHRGEIDKPKQVVPPGALSALTHVPARFTLSTDAASLDQGQRRAALADWIAHRDNVLTWRSIVNRVWHYHFGRGLCDTPSDFGRMGGQPSHPELIDWLAVWFRDDAAGSLKRLHKLIVMSETYRQSSRIEPTYAQIDSSNRLLWRQNMHRLDADSFRDFVLAAAGQLDLTESGPSVQHFKQSPGPQATPNLDYMSFDWNSPGANRRSIYRYVWRGIPDPLMSALDFPDLGLLSPNRLESTSPLQALALMNNPFILHFSNELAKDVSRTVQADLQVREVVQRIWLREPSDSELKSMTAYVERYSLVNLCRTLFNSSEFLFVP